MERKTRLPADMKNLRERPRYRNGKRITDLDQMAFEIRARVKDDRGRRRKLRHIVIGYNAAILWRNQHRTWASLGEGLGDKLERNDAARKLKLGHLLDDYMRSDSCRQRDSKKQTTFGFPSTNSDFWTISSFLWLGGKEASYKREFADKHVIDITQKEWMEFRNHRLHTDKVAHSTLRREITVIRCAYNYARDELFLDIPHPFARGTKWLKLQSEDDFKRERLLLPEERLRLYKSIETDGCKGGLEQKQLWLSLVQLALNTGLRRGVLLRLEWKDIDGENKVITIPSEYCPSKKKKAPPIVPLTYGAWESLLTYSREIPEGNRTPSSRVFPITGSAHEQAWRRICIRANPPLEDLRFHDLRHTALTNFASLEPEELSIRENAYMAGHTIKGTTTRYEHLKLVKRIRTKLTAAEDKLTNELLNQGSYTIDHVAQDRLFHLSEEQRKQQPFDENAGKTLYQWEGLWPWDPEERDRERDRAIDHFLGKDIDPNRRKEIKEMLEREREKYIQDLKRENPPT